MVVCAFIPTLQTLEEVWLYKQIDGWMDERMHACMDAWIDAWIDN